MDLIAQCSMENEHPFVDVSAYSIKAFFMITCASSESCGAHVIMKKTLSRLKRQQRCAHCPYYIVQYDPSKNVDAEKHLVSAEELQSQSNSLSHLVRRAVKS